ncbi:hypothetical protein C0992_008701, partial [Termitomyces sp. T32_za158]
MKADGGFERLARNDTFTDNVISIILDEAHCISAWGSFRPEYREIGRLRHVLPRHIPLLVTSATLPPHVLNDIKGVLELRPSLEIFRQSISRPNIHITVRPILSPLSSFEDITFVLRNWKPGDPPPPKFLIFFDNINESIAASMKLRNLLPTEFRDKIKWFNSDMSTRYKDDESQKLTSGDTWGMCTTDSFGMGMDLPDVRVVIQWRGTCSISTLWQRFGRAGRNRELEATAILLIEKDYTDEERTRKEERKVARQRVAAQKRSQQTKNRNVPQKRARTAASTHLQTNPHQPSPATIAEDQSDKQPSLASIAEDESDKENVKNLEIDELRHRYLTESRMPDQSGHRKKGALERAMDDFINAKARGLSCRAAPIEVYFENEKAAVDPTACLPMGCPRCIPPPPHICCDIHSPHSFEHCIVPPIKAATSIPRSRLPKIYSPMTEQDHSLQDALDGFWQTKMIERYGVSLLKDFGPTLIMPEGVLDRIVSCARYFKIQTAEDLLRETRWDECARYGEQVVDLILQHRPLPHISAPISQTPMQFITPNKLATSSNTASAPKSRAPAKCSSCGGVGHT